MADYKVVNAEKLNSALDSLADSIRTKSGVTGELAFPEPNEFKSAVDIIPTIINGTNPTTIISNGNHATDGYSHVNVDVPPTIPDGYVKPIGNLINELITRASSNSSHKATIPYGYYVNSEFSISDWKSGQITGGGTSGEALSIPFSSIGFVPRWVILIINNDSINTKGYMYSFFSTGSASRCIFKKSSSEAGSSATVHATINSNGVTFPTYGGSTTKYAKTTYRWYALR